MSRLVTPEEIIGAFRERRITFTVETVEGIILELKKLGYRLSEQDEEELREAAFLNTQESFKVA